MPYNRRPPKGYVDTRSPRHFYGRTIPRPVYKNRAYVNKQAARKRLKQTMGFNYMPMTPQRYASFYQTLVKKRPVKLRIKAKPVYKRPFR